MKKHVLMLFTLLLVMCCSSLFADRDIQGSTVSCQQPYYVPGPGGTTTLNFDLNVVNPDPLDPARATTVLLNFPVGVAVANTGSLPVAAEATDFIGAGPEFLDYGLETGDGSSVTTITFSDLTGVLPGIYDHGPIDGTASVTVLIDPLVWSTTDMNISYTIIGTSATPPGSNNTVNDILTLPAPPDPAEITNLNAYISADQGVSAVTAIVNSKVTVTCDVVNETATNGVWADMTGFGLSTTEYLSLSPIRDGSYEGTFTVPAGSIDATAQVVAWATNGFPSLDVSQTFPTVFTVDNQIPDFTPSSAWLTIDTDNPQLGIANVGDVLQIDVSGAVVTGTDDASWNIFWTANVNAGNAIPNPAEIHTGAVISGALDLANYSVELRAYDDAGNQNQETLISSFAFDNIIPVVTNWGAFTLTDQTTETNGIADLNNEAADNVT